MVKPHLILREKGLNHDFKLKGGDFDGTLLDLMNKFYYVKVLGFKKGVTAKCIKEDVLDDFCNIPKTKRWNIGDTILINKVLFTPYGIFLENEEGFNLNIIRCEVSNEQ